MTKPRLVSVSADPADQRLAAALRAPRIAIERISPQVDGGRYPARAVAGQPVAIEADIFMDGHDRVQAQLAWDSGGIVRHVPMRPLGNDRWRAEFTPEAPGRCRFTIEAWFDRAGTLQHEIDKKAGAGQPVEVAASPACVARRAVGQSRGISPSGRVKGCGALYVQRGGSVLSAGLGSSGPAPADTHYRCTGNRYPSCARSGLDRGKRVVRAGNRGDLYGGARALRAGRRHGSAISGFMGIVSFL
jgi:hypothetical protein